MIKEVTFALECYLKPAFYTVLLIGKNDSLLRNISVCGNFSCFIVRMCERIWNIIRDNSCFFLPTVVLQMGQLLFCMLLLKSGIHVKSCKQI